MPRNHQNKAQNGREDDEGNGGLGLAAKQSHHDGDDGDKTQNTDDKVTLENVSFCFSGLKLPAPVLIRCFSQSNTIVSPVASSLHPFSLYKH